VPHQAAQGALVGERVTAVKTGDGIQCQYCQSRRVFRVYRQGFLQEKIYPIFGFYPWKCKTCSAFMILRCRKGPSSKKAAYSQSSAHQN